ncbi:hypothetical protein GCM10023333_14560 [Ferrimonas pelagia]|uniref:Uncharacterized protein n=1 Tax=Ferrimonas pelagia TaxID=1177826 RepID=A0ABP9EKC6_9GAMM
MLYLKRISGSESSKSSDGTPELGEGAERLALGIRDIEMPFCSMIAPKSGVECRWVRGDRELGGALLKAAGRFCC